MIHRALIISLITILSVLQNAKCESNSLVPHFEEVEVTYVNETFIDKRSLVFKINYKPDSKNTLKVRVKLIKDLPENLYVRVNISSRIFGQEVPSGLAFYSKFCDAGFAKYFYDIMVKPLGVKECPPKKALAKRPSDFSLYIYTPDGVLYEKDLTYNEILSVAATKESMLLGRGTYGNDDIRVDFSDLPITLPAGLGLVIDADLYTDDYKLLSAKALLSF